MSIWQILFFLSVKLTVPSVFSALHNVAIHPVPTPHYHHSKRDRLKQVSGQLSVWGYGEMHSSSLVVLVLGARVYIICFRNSLFGLRQLHWHHYCCTQPHVSRSTVLYVIVQLAGRCLHGLSLLGFGIWGEDVGSVGLWINRIKHVLFESERRSIPLASRSS